MRMVTQNMQVYKRTTYNRRKGKSTPLGKSQRTFCSDHHYRNRKQTEPQNRGEVQTSYLNDSYHKS